MSTTSAAPAAALRNVAVIGGSYVGAATAKELIDTLPPTHRVVLIEKQERFGHLFSYPRFAIVGGHEHKAFIPTTLPPPHLTIRAAAESISPTSVSLDRPVELDGKTVQSIEFDALVVATGTKLTPPGTMPGESKKEGIEYLRGIQEDIKGAQKIVILGGGAVGVQMATDLAIVYKGEKDVTVVQSRTLMPRFHPLLHETCMKRFDELKIKTVLGSRAIVPEGGFAGVKEVKLVDGRTVEADFVIQSTGQIPNSGPLKSLSLTAFTPSGFIRVKPTFEVAPIGENEQEATKRIFAVGDIADSGAPKAARPGAVQAGVVARNIAALLSGAPSSSFETYTPDPAAIHLTLGVIESIIFRNPPSTDPSKPLETFDGEPMLKWRDDGKLDMGIEGVWERRAPGFVKSEEDYWK